MVRNALIAVYILAVLAISAVARAEVRGNMIINATTADLQNQNIKTYVGEIVTLDDGSFGLVNEAQQFLALRSQVDMTPYIGFKVMVRGIELEHQLASAKDFGTVDPLPSFESGSKSILFLVFGINEIM